MKALCCVSSELLKMFKIHKKIFKNMYENEFVPVLLLFSWRKYSVVSVTL